jgi:hypothetical protein
MSENLEEQYLNVVTYLDGYRKFENIISKRLAKYLLRHPSLFFKMGKRTFSANFQLIGKNPEMIKGIINTIATPEEKNSVYFKIVCADYITNALSADLEGRYEGYNFKKIKELHEFKKNRVTKLDIKSVLGAVMGFAFILLKNVPQSVVKRVVAVETYELYISIGALVVLIYLFVIMLPMWFVENKISEKQKFIGRMLEYTTINNG